MADITLTGGIRSNLLSLQNTTSLIERTQFRLSTGKDVNSAIDDPLAFFSAQSLSNRASDLMTRKDGIDQGVSALEWADSALTSMTDMLNSAKATLNQAAEDATKVSQITSREITAAERLDITDSDSIGADDDNIEFTVTDAQGNSETTTLTLTDGATIYEFAQAIDDIDTQVTARFNITTNKLEIEAAKGVTIEISDDTDDVGDALDMQTNTGVAFGDDSDTLGLGNSVSSIAFGAAAEDMVAYEEAYKSLLEEMQGVIEDAAYKGVNLLKDGEQLSVTFNEDGTQSLEVDGVDFTVQADDTGVNTGLGLGLQDDDTTAISTFSQLRDGFDTEITRVDAAITKVRNTQFTFGTNLSIVKVRQEFTDNLVNSLEGGAAKLTNADMNEESANMLALQTRQQLGTISLSIANQAEQAVLRLF